MKITTVTIDFISVFISQPKQELLLSYRRSTQTLYQISHLVIHIF